MLFPLLAWLFRFFLAAGGHHAIGNFDIVTFFFSPVGLIALATILPAGFAINFMKFSGIMFIGRHGAPNGSATWFDALKKVFQKSPQILGLSLVWLSLVLVLISPFIIGVWMVVNRLLSGHDINYFLQVRPPEFTTALMVAGVMLSAGALVSAFFFVMSLFTLPAVLFENIPFYRAFGRSLHLTRGKRRPIILTLFTWLVCWVACGAVINGILYLLERTLILAAGSKLSILVPVLGLITGINVLSAVALTFVGSSFGCLLVNRLYLRSFGAPGIVKAPLRPQKKISWRLASGKGPMVLLVVLSVISFSSAVTLVEDLDFEDRVEITAHRGSSGSAPENTVSAVLQAIEDGADFAEIDVQLTADDMVVVAHDKDLMRIAGLPLVISQTAYTDLGDIDAGSHFDPAFKSERVPTLVEVALKTKDRIRLYVELKDYKGAPRVLVTRVLEILNDTGLTDTALIMSLDYAILREVRRQNPKVVIGYTPAVSLGSIHRLDVDFLAVSTNLARDRLIAAAHAQGKEIHVWTVDRPVDISLMIDRGVDNIITNHPAAVRLVLEKRAELSNIEKILLRFRNLYVN